MAGIHGEMKLKMILNYKTKIKGVEMKSVLSNDLATREKLSFYASLSKILPDPDSLIQGVSKPIEHYKKLLNDGRLSAAITQRKAFVKAMLYEFVEKKKNTEEIKLLFENLPVNELMEQVLDSVYFGYTVHEIIWEFRENKFMPKAITEKPQDWFAFDQENTLKMKNPKKFNDLIDLPDYKFILSQHKPTYTNPYGDKLVKECYWFVKLKANAVEYWSYFIEKFGSGFITGELPSSLYESKKDEFLQDLIDLRKTGAIVKREGAKLDILESKTKGGSTSAFKEFKDDMNEEISIAILTETLTQNSKTVGSYSQSKTHQEMIETVVEADKKVVEKFFNTLINYYNLLNYGEIDSTKIMLYSKKEIDKNLADRDKVLTDQGVNFSKKYYKENYNLKDDDFTLKTA